MRDIRDRLLGGSAAGHELYALWREYEDNATPGMPVNSCPTRGGVA
jgi:hypothetical protein